jgi:hypothetical protein
MDQAALAAAPTDFDAAYAAHLRGVYDRVLFPKLAAAGWAPRSAAEADRYRSLAYRLYELHQEKLAAEAEQQGSLLDYAASYLDAYDGGRAKQAAVARVAGQFAADPAVLANAVALAAMLDAAPAA